MIDPGNERSDNFGNSTKVLSVQNQQEGGTTDKEDVRLVKNGSQKLSNISSSIDLINAEIFQKEQPA